MATSILKPSLRCCSQSLSQLRNTVKSWQVYRCNAFSSQASEKEVSLNYLEGDLSGVAVLAMNRPAARNAFSRKMVAFFEEAIESLKFDKNVRAFIIRSEAPGIFSAGADLKERATMKEHEVGPFVAKLRGMVNAVSALPMPVIAALDGTALGGGMEMALACDLRVAANNAKLGLVETKLAIIPGAASNAKMGLSETKLAIIPGGGGTQRLPRLVGPAVAKELIFTGRAIDGEQAQQIGLVNHAVQQNDDGDAAYQRALQLAAEILPNGPVGVKMAKIAISKGIEVDLESGLSFEQLCYAQVIPTKDRMEGLKAFREKRPPKYMGE